MRIISFFLAMVFIMGCKKEPSRTFEKNNKTEIKARVIQIEKTKRIVTQPLKKQTLLDYSFKAENVKTLQDSAAYLKHYYNQFAKTKDSLSEVLFFNMLPDTFESYRNLIGYVFDEKDNISYNFYFIHNQFEKGNDYANLRFFIPKKKYASKIITNGINGTWDSDDIALLQDKIWNLYKTENNLFFEVLNTKTQSEVSSFWIFYFDGPAPNHPSKVKMYEDILQKLETLDSTMIPIVKSAYAKVQEDWKVR